MVINEVGLEGIRIMGATFPTEIGFKLFCRGLPITYDSSLQQRSDLVKEMK